MRVYLKNTFIIAAVTGIVWLTFAVLPTTYHVEVRETVEASPDVIYAILDEPTRWEQWTAWDHSKDLTLTYQHSGPNHGVGSVTHWTGDTVGSGRRIVTEALPPHKLAFDIYFGKNPVPARSVITLTSYGVKTLVRWEIIGDMSYAWYGRFMIPWIKKMLHDDFEDSLDRLEDMF